MTDQPVDNAQPQDNPSNDDNDQQEQNLRPVHPRVANEVQIERIIDSIIAPGPLQESAILPSATADGKGMNGGRQRPLPSAADGKRLRQSRLR